MGCRVFFVIACLAAAGVPFLPVSSRTELADQPFPGWPASFEGLPLRRLEMSQREEAFSKRFPGRMASFSDGRRTILIRWVTRTTRKLHPAADCFRGVGYKARPLALRVDPDGRRWGCTECTHGTETLRVCERIHDSTGRGWTDVSSWYWAALLGKTSGPWWAVTLVEATTSTNSPGRAVPQKRSSAESDAFGL